VLFLMSPWELFGGTPADARFIPPAATLGVLACRFRLPARSATGLLAAWLALTGMRLAAVTAEWTAASAQIASQVALLKELPAEARLYPAVLMPDPAAHDKRRRASFHVAHYATIYRHAYCPTIIADPRQQPLLLRVPPTSAPGPEALAVAVREFDFVLCFAVPAEDDAYLQAHCQRTGGDGINVLYQPRTAHHP
jgi:hypothetical protein